MQALLAFGTVLFCLLMLSVVYGVARIVLALRALTARQSVALAGVRA